MRPARPSGRLSALSETLDRIDIGHARKVFVDAFLANRRGWEVWLPTVPLDELYGKRIERWFAEKNVVTRLQSGVRRVVADSPATRKPAATGVELRSGEQIDIWSAVFGVAVPLGPIIGGWLHDAYGWRSVFWFLTLLGIATWIGVAWLLPETLPPVGRQSAHPRAIAAA